ncbi:MAG TPA: VOC family protein [Gaiellaceae bacterium]|jgi:catechol 2,3-dioxygenase-like lactoylglutathione lyase family enzyme
MRPKTLDHIALWVADRDRIAEFLEQRLTMHVIERTDKFTLIGTNARRGKLTLFDEEGPRERGALKHVAFRVNDLDAALGELEGVEVEREDGAAYFDVYEGLRLGVVQGETDVDYDLDHVALFSESPKQTATTYAEFGFAPEDDTRVEVGGAFVEFHPGEPGDPEKPLLNHLAVLVDSADETLEDAKEAGIDVADVVDAPNTLAVFVWGPEHVKIEYVEQKPTFALK